MVRASDFGPVGRCSTPASDCHRMQIGQNAFLTSLPLPTQERAWHDWIVGLGNECACAVWLVSSHIGIKSQRVIELSRLVVSAL